MKAVEFKAKIENQKIAIPNEHLVLKDGQEVKVIVLIQEDTDEKVFKELAAKQFLEGYTAEDAIYDNY